MVVCVAAVVGAIVAKDATSPAIGGLAVSAAVVVGVRRWRWMIYGLLAYLPFYGVPAILLYPNTTLPLAVKDVLFVMPAYVGFSIEVVLRRRLRVMGAPLLPLALLSVIVIAQVLNPQLPGLLIGLVGIKVWLFYIPLLFLGYHLIQDLSDLDRVLAVMIWAAVVPAVIGVVEAILLYAGNSQAVYALYGQAASAVTQDFTSFTYEGGAVLRRVPSTFTFVTQYYLFSVSMIAVSWGWWQSQRSRGRWTVAGGVVWVTMVASAFASGSRGSFLFVPILMLLILIVGRHVTARSLLAVVIPLLLLASASSLLGSSSASVFGQSLSVGTEEFGLSVNEIVTAVDRAPLGLGTGGFTGGARHFADPDTLAEFRAGAFESWYTKAILELGIPGVMVALLVFGILVANVLPVAWAPNGAARPVAAALVGLLLWVLITNIKGQYLDLEPVSLYFWLFAGVLLRLRSISLDSILMPDLRKVGA